MNYEKKPIVELFDLEMSENAVEWMDNHGKIRDIEKFHRYLTETFQDPLRYVLEHFNDSLKEGNLAVQTKYTTFDPLTLKTNRHDL